MNGDLDAALRARELMALNSLPTAEVEEQKRLIAQVQAGLDDVRSVEDLDALSDLLGRAKGLNDVVESRARRWDHR